MKRRGRVSGKRAREETAESWEQEAEPEKRQLRKLDKSRREQDHGKQWKEVSKGSLSAVVHSFIYSFSRFIKLLLYIRNCFR